MKGFLCLILVTIATVGNSKKNSLTSKKEMEKLVQSEAALFKILDNYTENLERRTQKLKTYHEEFRRAYEDSKNGIEGYLDNPVNLFLFVRRLLVTWQEVEKVMQGDVGKDWSRELNVHKVLKTIKLPTKEEFSFAVTQVKKLQDMYQLTAKEMADGGPYGIPLNSGDCFEMGKEAYEIEDYDHAYDWLQESWNRVDDGRSKGAQTVEYLAAVAYLRGRVRRALELTEKLLEMSPNHEKAAGNIKFYNKRLAEIERDRMYSMKKIVVRDVLNWQEEDLEDLTKEICTGNVTLSNKVRAELKCRYTTRKNKPYLRLAPFKEEDMFVSPRIVIYHDVLSANDIDMLKASGRPQLVPIDAEGAKLVSSAWITEQNERIFKLSERMTDFTGLSLETADLMYVRKYDTTGFFGVQLDGQEGITPTVRKSGSKIASIHFFLDEGTGGGVVFPALKLQVPSRKGSALFWYNLRRSGDVDDLSLHGTCPVESSEHWEAVKWIRSFGNEFRRPCGMINDLS